MTTNKRLKMIIMSLELLTKILQGVEKAYTSDLPDDLKVEGVGQRVEDFQGYEEGEGAFFIIVSSKTFPEHDPNLDPPILTPVHTEIKKENV